MELFDRFRETSSQPLSAATITLSTPEVGTVLLRAVRPLVHVYMENIDFVRSFLDYFVCTPNQSQSGGGAQCRSHHTSTPLGPVFSHVSVPLFQRAGGVRCQSECENQSNARRFACLLHAHSAMPRSEWCITSLVVGTSIIFWSEVAVVGVIALYFMLTAEAHPVEADSNSRSPQRPAEQDAAAVVGRRSGSGSTQRETLGQGGTQGSLRIRQQRGTQDESQTRTTAAAGITNTGAPSQDRDQDQDRSGACIVSNIETNVDVDGGGGCTQRNENASEGAGGDT